MKAIYRREPEDGTIPRLRIGHQYLVVGISDQSLRVINEGGEPILYARECFDFTDSKIPEDWVRRDYADGEFHIDPPECAKPGFYEDYFDHKPEAVSTFERVLARLKAE